MDESNVFNSFSFQRWAAFVRQQKIEEEILRQRIEQVTRLRTKLIRERILREQVDVLSDEDVNRLVEYLNSAQLHRSTTKSYIQKRIGRGDSLESVGKPTKLSKKLPEEPVRNEAYFFSEIGEVEAIHGTIEHADGSNIFTKNKKLSKDKEEEKTAASLNEGGEIMRNTRILSFFENNKYEEPFYQSRFGKFSSVSEYPSTPRTTGQFVYNRQPEKMEDWKDKDNN